MPDLLDGLNPNQRAVVTHPGGPLLVIAGAGTGKTRTLTERFAWLVEQGTAVNCILALTFSEPAAAEMRERLELILEAPYEELNVFTFLVLLREAAPARGAGGGGGPVLLAGDSRRPAGPAARPHRRADPAPAPDPRQPGAAPCELRVAHRSPEGGDDLRGRAAGLGGALPPRTDSERAAAAREREFARVYADHDRLLAERGALDFGDLVVRAFRLLHERPHVRERTARRFRHVLVDDYRATNFAQRMLLRLLVEEHGNVTVAGDDERRSIASAERLRRT